MRAAPQKSLFPYPRRLLPFRGEGGGSKTVWLTNNSTHLHQLQSYRHRRAGRSCQVQLMRNHETTAMRRCYRCNEPVPHALCLPCPPACSPAGLSAPSPKSWPILPPLPCASPLPLAPLPRRCLHTPLLLISLL